MTRVDEIRGRMPMVTRCGVDETSLSTKKRGYGVLERVFLGLGHDIPHFSKRWVLLREER